MSHKIKITQSLVCCSGPNNKLVLRLANNTLRADGKRFLDFILLSQSTYNNQTSYLIEYDNTLLAVPVTYLTVNDFCLVCIDDYTADYACENCPVAIPSNSTPCAYFIGTSI